MSEHGEESSGSVVGNLMDKIKEKFDSSSDSDTEKPEAPVAPPLPVPVTVPVPEAVPKEESVSAKVYRLFGREKPVHQVLGGGRPADVFLWRNKKASAVALGGATAIWVLFELMEYHLLSLVCYSFIFVLAVLFLWSNAMGFVNKAPPRIPDVHIPEDLAVNVALSLRFEVNRAVTVLRDIASGRDLRKFLAVVAGLWVLSLLGNCFNFLTLFYIAFVLLHTVPVLYEKYEDKVDAFGEKAMGEIKKQYAVFDAKCLSKIPRGPLKDKKH